MYDHPKNAPKFQFPGGYHVSLDFYEDPKLLHEEGIPDIERGPLVECLTTIESPDGWSELHRVLLPMQELAPVRKRGDKAICRYLLEQVTNKGRGTFVKAWREQPHQIP